MTIHTLSLNGTDELYVTTGTSVLIDAPYDPFANAPGLGISMAVVVSTSNIPTVVNILGLSMAASLTLVLVSKKQPVVCVMT
jgi:hypothetical protein